MIRVFICGPFRAPTMGVQYDNIARAGEAAMHAWRLGCFVLCPHLNSGSLYGLIDEAHVLAAYRQEIVRCDAVLLVQGWQEAEGALAEYEVAVRAGVPVFEDVAELERWMGERERP